MPRFVRQLLVLCLGTLATVVLLEVVLAGGQWAFVRWQAAQNLSALEGGRGEVRILTIGESTTAVAGDDDGRMLVPHTAYPVQLEQVLRDLCSLQRRLGERGQQLPPFIWGKLKLPGNLVKPS